LTFTNIQVFWKMTPCRLVFTDVVKQIAASMFSVQEP